MLVLLQIVRSKLPNIKFSYYFTLLVTVFFSACDSLKNVDLLPQTLENLLSHLPLYSDGMAWLIPAFVALALSLLLGRKKV